MSVHTILIVLLVTFLLAPAGKRARDVKNAIGFFVVFLGFPFLLKGLLVILIILAAPFNENFVPLNKRNADTHTDNFSTPITFTPRPTVANEIRVNGNVYRYFEIRGEPWEQNIQSDAWILDSKGVHTKDNSLQAVWYRGPEDYKKRANGVWLANATTGEVWQKTR